MKQWIGPIASAFIGGVAMYITSNLSGGLPPRDQWSAAAVGAVMTGIVAVAHLYQPKPGGPS